MNFKYFSEEELKCKCGCGQSNPNPQFVTLMNIMDKIREEYGKPMVVTSGYRCPFHPVEVRKSSPGQHSIAAIDIGVSHSEALKLLRVAMKYPEIKGLGVQQKGSSRFLHFDIRSTEAIWSY